MAENKFNDLPKFENLDALVEFFDSNDMGDYELPEINFEVDLQRRTHLFALDEDLADQLSRIARRRQIPTQTLITSWLREKAAELANS